MEQILKFEDWVKFKHHFGTSVIAEWNWMPNGHVGEIFTAMVVREEILGPSLWVMRINGIVEVVQWVSFIGGDGINRNI